MINMNIGDNLLYSDRYFSNEYDQLIYLKRVPSDTILKPKYYLNVYTMINNELIKQGYLYFYLDLVNKTATFIGVGIKPQYRNLNIASLLISCWIDLCLNNNIVYFDANEKQKKPFLLYLLKTL